MKAQVAAIDAWNRAQEMYEHAARAAELSREMRLDLNRRLEGRRRQQAAMAARTEEQLRASGDPIPVVSERRAVVAHRNRG